VKSLNERVRETTTLDCFPYVWRYIKMSASNESPVFSWDDESMLDAFSKAFQSAVSNNLGAVSLNDCDCPALAASVAIAALEEIGKMMLLDDLLFGRSPQPQLERCDKLEAVELYSRFLQCLSSDDPRRHDLGLNRVIAVAGVRFESSKQKLSDLLGGEFRFGDLYALKQRGLYSHTAAGAVRVNRESANPELTKAIIDIVRCITDTLHLLLGSSFEHYRSFFLAYCDSPVRVSQRVLRKDLVKQVTGMFDLEGEHQ
jgi:hypothetical protein